MVLQHEAAEGVSTLPYLSTRFRGVPVRELLGRSATRLPPCNKDQAVYYGWRDPSPHRGFQGLRKSGRLVMPKHMPPVRNAKPPPVRPHSPMVSSHEQTPPTTSRARRRLSRTFQ